MNKKYIKWVFLIALAIFTLSVQGEIISGKVKTRLGIPVSGAKVFLVGNYERNTLTDKEGNFKIVASIGDFVKIETSDNHSQANKITGIELTIEIQNESNMISLGNGLETPFIETSGAISTITSDEIMKSSAMNPGNALYGNGLGLTVLQKSDVPWGDSPTMYVRGISSLYGNSPTVLIDGFERPLSSITKDEIDKIEILKDAAATAIYGLKGSNGIISVTTKKGKYESKLVSVSYDHAFNTALRLPQFVNAQTFAKGVNEALSNDGVVDKRYNDYEIGAFASGNSPYYANVNWVNELLKNTGLSNIYNVNFQGGGKNSRYFSSINLMNNNGYVKPDNIVPQFSSQLKYSQFNARTNLDIDLTSTTEFSVKLSGTMQAYNLPGVDGQGIMSLIYNTPAAAFPIKTVSGKFGGSNTWSRNPIAEITAKGFQNVSARTFLADIGLTQHLDMLLNGLSVSVRIGLDNYASYYEGQNQDYESEVNTVLFDTNEQPSGLNTNLVGKNTTPSRYHYLGSQWRTYNFIGQADYNRTFKQSVLKASIITAYNQDAFAGQHNTINRVRLSGYAHYGFKDKYFADATVTMHGSNLMPDNNKFGYFPSLSGAWVISKESFLKNIKELNLLKLRASIGITGRDILPSGAHDIGTQFYGGRPGAIFGSGFTGYGGLGELSLPSNNLTYEKSYKYNIGIDTRIFNALDLSLDVFYAQTRDILTKTTGTTSGVIGLSPDYYNTAAFLPFQNVGAVDNKGIEVGINFEKTIGYFSILAGGNFTFSRNIIIEEGEGYYPNENAKQTGKSIGQPIGYKTIGFFSNASDISNSPKQTLYPVVPGDLKFADLYGDNHVIDTYDRMPLGYSTLIPEINYSFNLGLEYKGIGIDAMLQGVANYSDYLLNNGQYLPLVGNSNLSQYYYDNRWTPENGNALFPRLSMNNNTNNYNVNSTWVADASFVKLRHCEVYYKIPHELIAALKLQAIKLYVRGMDLFTLDKIKIIDPESINTRKLYPSTMSVNLGAKIEF